MIASVRDSMRGRPAADVKPLLFQGASPRCRESVLQSDGLASHVLFTCNFAIKARERYGEGLHGTHRVAVVQCENVVGYSAKLHHNVVHCKKNKELKMKDTLY